MIQHAGLDLSCRSLRSTKKLSKDSERELSKVVNGGHTELACLVNINKGSGKRLAKDCARRRGQGSTITGSQRNNTPLYCPFGSMLYCAFNHCLYHSFSRPSRWRVSLAPITNVSLFLLSAVSAPSNLPQFFPFALLQPRQPAHSTRGTTRSLSGTTESCVGLRRAQP